jgi:hypothetical protein
MEKMVSAKRGRWSGRLRQRRYLLVVVEIAMARSEEDGGAGVVFVYVVMCMAVGNEGLWGGAGEVVDRFWWEAWFGQPWVVEVLAQWMKGGLVSWKIWGCFFLFLSKMRNDFFYFFFYLYFMIIFLIESRILNKYKIIIFQI